MADNTDNRDGMNGEDLPEDLERLVNAAEEDAEAAGDATQEGRRPPRFLTQIPRWFPKRRRLVR